MRGALRDREPERLGDVDELAGVGRRRGALPDRQPVDVVAEEQLGRRRARRVPTRVHRRDDLGGRAEEDVDARVLDGELDDAPHDVVRAACDLELAGLVALDDRPGGLVGALGERARVGDDDERRALVQVRRDDARLDRVAADREERHASAVHAPLVHDHRLELARDARLEDALVHVRRDADAVVEHGQRATVALAAGREEDAPRVRVAGVAQQLDDDVFDAADVVLRLPALGLRDSRRTNPSPRVSSTLR